jgi:hypothetical protein
MFDNKKLAMILAALVVLFVFVRWIKSDKDVRNFDAELFVLDTAQVHAIKLYPKAENQEEILFTRDAAHWTVSKGGISSDIPSDRVHALLRSVQEVRPERLAARSEDKWAQYQVNDSLGTRVILEDASGNKLVDLMIGKFSYRQSAPQANMMGGRGGISGYTYVRNYDDEATFATEGFLSMTFDRDFNSFRDKTLVRAEPDNIRRIVFRTPDAGPFTLTQSEGKWLIGEEAADSTEVARYLNQLRNISGATIDDDFQATGQPDYQVTVAGDNMEDIKVGAYAKDDGFRLQSSINPGVIIESDSSGVFSRIFKEAEAFFGEE